MFDDGASDGFVGADDCFLLFAPLNGGEGVEYVECAFGFGGCLVDVFGVSELGVQSEAEDFGCVGGVDGGVVDVDIELVAVFVSIRGVEGGSSFGGIEL